MMPIERNEDDPLAPSQAAKMRRILLLAFGGLLTLMIVAGLDALHALRELDTIERQVNRRFSAHSQALNTILISVHIYHDQMERYLSAQSEEDQSVADAVNHRGAEVLVALQRYPSDMDPEERALLAQIQQKFLDQENSFATLATSIDGQRQPDRQQEIYEQMMLRRAYILQVSRQVSSWNNRKLDEVTQNLAVSFGDVQTRLASMVALVLLAGLLLSMGGGIYILRLERQGRAAV